MKVQQKLLIACLVFLSVQAYAQVDSTQLTNGRNTSDSTILTSTSTSTKSKDTSPKAKKIKNPSQKSHKNKLFIGGGIGGHISEHNLYFNISPQVGYRLVNTRLFKLIPGISFTYQYNQYTEEWFKTSSKNPSTSVYGPGVFARFFVKNFFAHAEYQYLWYSPYYENGTNQDDFLLVGAGMHFPIAKRMGFSVSVLFDVLPHSDNYKIYQNPIINFGISF